MNQLLLHEAFFAAAAPVSKRVAVTHQGSSRTFGEIADAIPLFARALAGAGLRRGDRLGCWCHTDLDLVPLYFASAALGVTFAPINPKFTDDEARAAFDLADPRIVVADDAHEGDLRLADLSRSTLTGGIDVDPVQETDGHIMYFTSGTTGKPKAIELSHRADLLRSLSGLTNSSMGPTVSMFPLFHMAGWSSAMGPWFRGAEVVLAEGEDAVGLLTAIERSRAERFYAIPAVWRRILELDLRDFNLGSLRQADSGTSATTLELLDAIHEALPQTTTTIQYGSTEAGGVCNLPFEDLHRKPGSVGPPCAGVLVRVDNDELWIKSPYLFSGYFRDEETSAAALVDGWFRSGELAEMDGEGYVTIIGRNSEIIRTGGESVAPAEVDAVIRVHTAVADCATAGIPDDDWGEIITVFVVLRPGATLTLEQLQEHCSGRLTRFRIPRRLIVVDAIPRTSATGQVRRRLLVDRA